MKLLQANQLNIFNQFHHILNRGLSVTWTAVFLLFSGVLFSQDLDLQCISPAPGGDNLLTWELEDCPNSNVLIYASRNLGFYFLLDSVRNQSTYLHQGAQRFQDSWEYTLVADGDCGFLLSDTLDQSSPLAPEILSISKFPFPGSIQINTVDDPKAAFTLIYDASDGVDPIDTINATQTNYPLSLFQSEFTQITVASLDACFNAGVFQPTISSLHISGEGRYCDSLTKIEVLNSNDLPFIAGNYFVYYTNSENKVIDSFSISRILNLDSTFSHPILLEADSVYLGINNSGLTIKSNSIPVISGLEAQLPLELNFLGFDSDQSLLLRQKLRPPFQFFSDNSKEEIRMLNEPINFEYGVPINQQEIPFFISYDNGCGNIVTSQAVLPIQLRRVGESGIRFRSGSFEEYDYQIDSLELHIASEQSDFNFFQALDSNYDFKSATIPDSLIPCFTRIQYHISKDSIDTLAFSNTIYLAGELLSDIPNAFTYKNGSTEWFYQLNPQFKGNWQFTIFNRWGKLLSQEDGTSSRISWKVEDSNGNQLPTGVYPYILEIEDFGIRRYETGNITIIK